MTSTSGKVGALQTSEDLTICYACGTQYDVDGSIGLSSCRICDDPRQYVPGSGQSWTTLRKLKNDNAGYHLEFKHEEDDKVWSISIQPVQPKVGIGQKAYLIQTPQGNVMWDCVAFLDQKAVDKINSLGGLRMIVISHPHFYTTWADWSSTFQCPVFLADPDKEWINRKTPSTADLQLLTKTHTELLPGITAIIAGGHFPGSMMLHVAPPNLAVPSLFHADTIMTVPSALNPDPAKPGATSFAFMWSIPNMIPQSPDQILAIWRAMKGFDVETTYGLFSVVRAEKEHRMSIPARVLESAKISVGHMGISDHEIFAETL